MGNEISHDIKSVPPIWRFGLHIESHEISEGMLKIPVRYLYKVLLDFFTLFFQVRQNKGIRWPCYYPPGNLVLLSLDVPWLLGALFYYVDTFWPPSYPRLTIVKELRYCYCKGKSAYCCYFQYVVPRFVNELCERPLIS